MLLRNADDPVALHSSASSIDGVWSEDKGKKIDMLIQEQVSHQFKLKATVHIAEWRRRRVECKTRLSQTGGKGETVSGARNHDAQTVASTDEDEESLFSAARAERGPSQPDGTLHVDSGGNHHVCRPSFALETPTNEKDEDVLRDARENAFACHRVRHVTLSVRDRYTQTKNNSQLADVPDVLSLEHFL